MCADLSKQRLPTPFLLPAFVHTIPSSKSTYEILSCSFVGVPSILNAETEPIWQPPLGQNTLGTNGGKTLFAVLSEYQDGA